MEEDCYDAIRKNTISYKAISKSFPEAPSLKNSNLLKPAVSTKKHISNPDLKPCINFEIPTISGPKTLLPEAPTVNKLKFKRIPMKKKLKERSHKITYDFINN